MKKRFILFSVIVLAVLLVLTSCSKSTEPEKQVATPIFNPPGGIYTAGQTVSISCDTEGAIIKYTTDGTEPTDTSLVYISPLSITSPTTIIAKAFRAGWIHSQVAIAAYSITGTVASPIFEPPGGTYIEEQFVCIVVLEGRNKYKEKNEKQRNESFRDNKTIRYTLDGTQPDSTSKLYTQPVLIPINTTLKAMAFKTDWAESEISTAEYTLKTSDPVFHPPGGLYYHEQIVTINCATDGATIRYTTDGSDLTESSLLYSSPINVSEKTNLKARAYKTDWTESKTTSAEYNLKTSTPEIDPPGGIYSLPQIVTLTCATEGAEIRYTTDGSNPSESSSLYSNPITISENAILKARAYKQLWTPSVTAIAQYFQSDIEVVLVEGGTFNPTANYTVTLSSFYIGRNEVTQAEYLSVMGSLPGQSPGVGDLHPVSRVTWFNAIEYCNRLSMMEGLTPAYSYGTYGTNPDNWPSGWNTSDNHTNVSCNWSTNGYRLPTEMEREYAARGGVTAKNAGTFNDQWAGTNAESQLVNYAWYWTNSGGTTHPVGTKIPNELGLYDMSGNVWNWVWDMSDWPMSYPSGSYTDPTGPESGSYRVVRGGSWDYNANHCTVSFRGHNGPASSGYAIGFRVCRVSP